MKTIFAVAVCFVCACSDSPTAPTTDASSDANNDVPDQNVPDTGSPDTSSDSSVEDMGTPDMRVPPVDLVVTSTFDDSECSATRCTLRGALETAADMGGNAEITFAITDPVSYNDGAKDVYVIAIDAPLSVAREVAVLAPDPVSPFRIEVTTMSATESAFVLPGNESRIQWLTILGNGSLADGVALDGDGSAIEGCSVVGFFNGIRVSGDSTIVENNSAEMNSNHGVAVESSVVDASITSTRVMDNQGYGVAIAAGNGPDPALVATIDGLQAMSNGSGGVLIERQNVRLSNGVISDNAGNGILVNVIGAPDESNESILIRGVSIIANDLSGVRANSAGWVSIGGPDRTATNCDTDCNDINGNGSHGIQLDNIIGGTISGNRIHSNDVNGIYIRNSGTPQDLVIGVRDENEVTLVPGQCQSECNEIYDNEGNGITLEAANGVKVVSNWIGQSNVDRRGVGIWVVDTENLSVEANVITGHNIGLRARSNVGAANIDNRITSNVIGPLPLGNACGLGNTFEAVSFDSAQGVWLMANNLIGCSQRMSNGSPTGANDVNVSSTESDFFLTFNGNRMGLGPNSEDLGSAHSAVIVTSPNGATLTNNTIANYAGYGIRIGNVGSNRFVRDAVVADNVIGQDLTGGPALIGIADVRFDASIAATLERNILNTRVSTSASNDVTVYHRDNTWNHATGDVPFIQTTGNDGDDGDLDVGPNTGLNSPAFNRLGNSLTGELSVPFAQMEAYKLTTDVIAGTSTISPANVTCTANRNGDFNCNVIVGVGESPVGATEARVVRITAPDLNSAEFDIRITDGVDTVTVSVPDNPADSSEAFANLLTAANNLGFPTHLALGGGLDIVIARGFDVQAVMAGTYQFESRGDIASEIDQRIPIIDPN